MSTRCQIAMVQEDNTILSIYAHYDGHIETTGVYLHEYYSTQEKAEALIGLGNLSYVSKEIGERQDFNAFTERNWDWCLAYGRDRGQQNQQAKTVKNKEELIEKSKLGWADYIYLYEDGCWSFLDLRQHQYSGWTELSGAIRTMIQ